MEIDPTRPAVEPAAEPAAVAPTAADITALQERLRNVDAEYARQREINERLAMRLVETARQPAIVAPTPPEPTAPDRDEDPEGWTNFMVERRVKAALDAQVAPLVQAYQADRQLLVGTAIEQSKAQVATRYPTQWKEHQREVEAYLQNFDQSVVARPGAIEEALMRFVGRATAAKDLEVAARDNAVTVAGRQSIPATDPPVRKAELTPKQTVLANISGLSAAQFEELRGPGALDIDAYQALKAAKPAGAKS